MIEINRVTRFMHKAQLLSRHRRLLTYSHRYVVTDEDLIKETLRAAAQASPAENTESETARMLDELMSDFDAENNEMDRRIFYEVMGR